MDPSNAILGKSLSSQRSLLKGTRERLGGFAAGGGLDVTSAVASLSLTLQQVPEHLWQENFLEWDNLKTAFFSIGFIYIDHCGADELSYLMESCQY